MQSLHRNAPQVRGQAIGFAGVLAVTAAFCVLFFDFLVLRKYFTGADYIRLIVPFYNFQSDCLQIGSWPLWNPFMNFGYPWVDNYMNSSAFPLRLLVAYTWGYRMEAAQLEILFIVFLGGLGLFLLLKELGRSTATAAIVTICYYLSGPVQLFTQWTDYAYNTTGLIFLIYGYHRAQRLQRIFDPVAISAVALSILGGFIAAAVLSLYLAFLYIVLDAVWRRNIRFGVKHAAVTLVVGAILSLPKWAPILLAMGDSPRTSAPLGGVPSGFGYFSLYDALSVLLPVKYYFSFYSGAIIPIALIFALCAMKFWLRPALVAFVLSFWYCLASIDGQNLIVDSALRSALVALKFPLLDIIRNNFLFLAYPLVFLLVYASEPLEAFIAGVKSRLLLASVAIFNVVMLVAYVTAYDLSAFSAAYVTQLALSVALASLVFSCKSHRLRHAGLILIVVADGLLVHARTDINPEPVVSMREAVIHVTDHLSVSHSFRSTALVDNRWSTTVKRDYLRPGIAEARNTPVLVTGSNDQRWQNFASMNSKQFAGIWHNAQQKKPFIVLSSDPAFARFEGQPLFTFKGTRGGSAEVRFSDLTCSSFSFDVSSTEAGAFELKQMADRRWRVSVDGESRPPTVTRENFMQVSLPAGNHEVVFRFEDPMYIATLITMALGWLVLISAWIATGWQRRLTNSPAS